MRKMSVLTVAVLLASIYSYGKIKVVSCELILKNETIGQNFEHAGQQVGKLSITLPSQGIKCKDRGFKNLCFTRRGK